MLKKIIRLVSITCVLVAGLPPVLSQSVNPQQSRASAPVVVVDYETYTYQLIQSTPAYKIWTTPPTERVYKDAAVPVETGSEIKVYAARNETEPFQVVVRPNASGSVTVSMGSFGSGITAELYQVKYVNIVTPSDDLGRTGPYPDPLKPINHGASVALTAGENTAIWVSLNVPAGAPSQDYLANIQIGSLVVPVRLHVFNFAIPDTLHVGSQMNFSYQQFLSAYSVPGYAAEYWNFVEMVKQFFIDRRLTPTSILWSGGLTSGFAQPYIDYDCGRHTFSDPYGIWGFEQPALRYIGGSGLMNGQFSQPFNGGAGFSAFMAASFNHNDPSVDQRPANFCGQARSASDWLQNPTSAYNQAWFSYITAMQDYLNSLGYLDEAYHYFANEPQDQADYDAVAWYSRYSHQAAPNLKLMVSEEPKPEIYNQTGAQIDLWLPVLQNFNPSVSQARAQGYGEQTWIYFLDSTRPPFFNPITLDHPAIEGKLTGWFLWKYRLQGLAYYAINDWSVNPWSDPAASGYNGGVFMLYPPSETNTPVAYGATGNRLVPSIRLETLRDGLEDYEYLYLLAGGMPAWGSGNAADSLVDRVIGGQTAYTRDSDFVYNLRRLIGAKLGGEISVIPTISSQPAHARAFGPPSNYYLNFQDPAGQPTANPLVVNGHTYLKISGSAYDAQAGYGWYAPPEVNWMTAWLGSAPNVLQRSVLYSDWGRQATFDFDLPNGAYDVTLSLGWQGGNYPHQKAIIEGVSFAQDEGTFPAASYLVRTKRVIVQDYKLTLEMGIFNEYTMLNYMDIETAPLYNIYAPNIRR